MLLQYAFFTVHIKLHFIKATAQGFYCVWDCPLTLISHWQLTGHCYPVQLAYFHFLVLNAAEWGLWVGTKVARAEFSTENRLQGIQKPVRLALYWKYLKCDKQKKTEKNFSAIEINGQIGRGG